MSAGSNEASEIGAGEVVSDDAQTAEGQTTVERQRAAATGAGVAPRLSQNRGAG